MKYAKRNDWGGYNVRRIDDSPAAAAQAAIYESLGWSRVVEAARPVNTPYLTWSAGYRPAEGGVVEEFFWSSPTVVPLSRDKLISVVASLGMLEQAIAIFKNDDAAKNWWANSMNYIEGSPMAVAFQQAFGLTLDQIHGIVEASRRV